MKLFRVFLRLYIWKAKNKGKPKERSQAMETKVTEFNVIGVDPTKFWVDGYGLWRDEEGRVFKDAILVTLRQDDAYWVSVACGQICYLHVNTWSQEPNGYLLELSEAELAKLFEQEKITGYTVIENKTKDIPQTFTVVSKEEAETLNVSKDKLQPVYYEFVYVQQ
jgi:hypothetical protein